MVYHEVTDEWWMKEKDAIIETLNEFGNNVNQPISQLECYISNIKREINNNFDEIHNIKWYQSLFTKRELSIELSDKLTENLLLLSNAEHKLKKAMKYREQMCYRIQHHWFDLIGVGYNDKPSRLTNEHFKYLDKRWNDANPNDQIEEDYEN